MKALGRELLQTTNADGGPDGSHLRDILCCFWRLGDALENLEVGIALELDLVALLLGKPTGLIFLVALCSDGPNLDIESKSDIFNSRGAGTRSGAGLHGRSAGGTMGRVGIGGVKFSCRILFRMFQTTATISEICVVICHG